jgi:hypothetical protein
MIKSTDRFIEVVPGKSNPPSARCQFNFSPLLEDDITLG